MLHRNLKGRAWDHSAETLVLDGTDHFSGADLASLCREATMGPTREAMKQPMGAAQRAISAADFNRALGKVSPSVGDAEVQMHHEFMRGDRAGAVGEVVAAVLVHAVVLAVALVCSARCY